MIRSTDKGTEEESLDSISIEPLLLTPKVEEKNNLDKITEEKKKTDPVKDPVRESVRTLKTASASKPVKAPAPVKANRKPPLRKSLVSVSEPLDKAMEELSLGLGDLDMEPGHDPGLGSSDTSRGRR